MWPLPIPRLFLVSVSIFKTASDAKIPLGFRAGLGSGGVVEGDLVAHGFELSNGSILGPVGVETGEELGAGILVQRAGGAHVPDRDEH